MKTLTSISQWQEIPEKEKKYWYIPETISSNMPIQDNNESLVSLKNEFEKHKLPIILASVSPEPYTALYLRSGVAQRLVQATIYLQKQTSNQVTIKVTDAFRPLELQRKYFEEIKNDIANKEQLTGKELWERVTQFIADPDLCPPHSTGGAIDLTLFDLKHNGELDMGTPVDTISDLANTWHEEVIGQQKINRELLFTAMTQAGFVNLTSEWWHYSYGDGYWAAYHEQSPALYGSVETYPTHT